MVDYLVASDEMFSHIHDFRVEPLPIDSDHCPLTFKLNLHCSTDGKTRINEKHSCTKQLTKIRWDSNVMKEFVNKQKQIYIQSEITKLQQKVLNSNVNEGALQYF